MPISADLIASCCGVTLLLCEGGYDNGTDVGEGEGCVSSGRSV